MTLNLEELVDRGDVAGALAAARDLPPRSVRKSLFATGGAMTDSAPYGEFVTSWYARLESPYLRAEAAEWFAQAYLTELADVPNAEHFGASMVVGLASEVIERLAQTLLSRELSDWAISPEQPLSSVEVEAWRTAGRVLTELPLPR